MLCRKPFVQGGHAYGCGQCLPCRISKRRVWAHRLMLEALQWKDNSFVTLTYAEDKLPKCKDGLTSTLRPEDVRNWLKRLRKRWEELQEEVRGADINRPGYRPSKLRFYLVGEYGDETQRPHYHAALFGYPSCAYGHSSYTASRSNCCAWCDTVRDTWGFGNVFLGQLENESAHYIAGYIVKKMTRKDHPALKGRYPEFARMSLKPGIGAAAMDEVASTLMWYELEQRLLDVPSSLAYGGKELPLGRYLRRRLRERVGKEVCEPAEVQIERSKQLQALLLDTTGDPGKSLAAALAEVLAPKVAALEARTKIFKKGKSL